MVSVEAEELYLFGLPRKTVSLTRKGISHQGLWYVFADCKGNTAQTGTGKKVQIAYDPEDVGRVYLVNGMTYQTFELAESCRKYAGTTESEWQMEQADRRESRREARRKDTEGRLKMLRDIKEIVDQAECLEKEPVSQEAIQKNRRKELA